MTNTSRLKKMYILYSVSHFVCSCFSFRHSRFGGSYVVQGLKSIGDKDVIYHRTLHNVSRATHNIWYKEIQVIGVEIVKNDLNMSDFFLFVCLV